jgi:hypothetical protein
MQMMIRVLTLPRPLPPLPRLLSLLDLVKPPNIPWKQKSDFMSIKTPTNYNINHDSSQFGTNCGQHILSTQVFNIKFYNRTITMPQARTIQNTRRSTVNSFILRDHPSLIVRLLSDWMAVIIYAYPIRASSAHRLLVGSEMNCSAASFLARFKLSIHTRRAKESSACPNN